MRQKGDDPGAVFDLVFEMAVAVVGGAFIPHLPEDLEPAHGQAADGGGVVHSLLAFVPVVGNCPGRFDAAAIGPDVKCCPQHLVAGASRKSMGSGNLWGRESLTSEIG